MFREFDEHAYRALDQAMQRISEAGKTGDEADAIAAQAFATAAHEVGPHIADTLESTMPQMLREHRKLRRRFHRQVRSTWGRALDMFYAVVVAAEECGANLSDADQPPSSVFDALSGIFARSCRTALEVHTLLGSGYPLGALARARTMHELMVIGAVLETYGQPDGDHPDLGDRYVQHGNILRWKDACTYQQHHHEMGLDPLPDDDMDRWSREVEELAARYGPTFKRPYGWAAPLHPGGSPTFADLERLAEHAQLRSMYRWASHEIHADARGDALNESVRAGRRVRITGPSDRGLSDPAIHTLQALTLTFLSFVLTAEPTPPSGVVSAAALSDLTSRAVDAFAQAERTVHGDDGHGPDSGAAEV